MLNSSRSEPGLQVGQPELVIGPTTRFPRPYAGTSAPCSPAGLAGLVTGISGGVGAVRTTTAGEILAHTLGLDPASTADLARVAVGGWRWARDGGHLGRPWYWARRTHDTQAIVTALDDSCLLVVAGDGTTAFDTMRSALKAFSLATPSGPCTADLAPFAAGRTR
ncbi:hypothetical protein ACFY4B_26620 [Kitasatospora sp. NPDC001261]|uniref:hypothetical protein n=1 Tax=Kitasatospora sp. NPDC001261 TaxID=3364012 RepID=UPI0036C9A3B0